jgi:hypothetical protein
VWLVRVEEQDGQVTQEILSNGLTVIVLEDHPTVPRLSHSRCGKVGSRKERLGITSTSHLLEHPGEPTAFSFPVWPARRHILCSRNQDELSKGEHDLPTEVHAVDMSPVDIRIRHKGISHLCRHPEFTASSDESAC